MLLAGDDLHQLRGFRPLLYPIFLATIYTAGGNWGVDLAIFVQHLLGVGTGLLVALLGSRLFRNRLSGLIGGLLFMLAPVPLYFEGELLIEPSYTFLICAALLLHLYAAEATGTKAAVLWLCCGASIVLIAQARANILVFLPIYPAFAIWRSWLSRDWKAVAPILGVLGGLVMGVVWGLVNLKQSDHFHLLPNQGGVALYLGNKRTADGMIPEQERRTLSGERYEDSIEVWAREEYQASMRAHGRQPLTDPMAVSKYWTRRTLEEIQADPAAWIGLMAKKSWLTFWNAEIPNNKAFAFLQQEFTWLRLLPVRWVVLLMLAPAGIWLAIREGEARASLILLLYTVLYSAANIAFFICDRYRYPVWPIMAVFAGGGLLALYGAIRASNFRRFAWIMASACGMAVLALPNWFGAKLPSFSRDYMFRSIACYEKGRFAEALADADRSTELNPRDATALHHQGNVLFALNRLEDAQVAYAQALNLSPGEASIWNNLGTALQAAGRTEEALDAFRRATASSPPSLNAFVGIALIEFRSGNLEAATSALADLEKHEPRSNATVLVVRSLIARRRGEAHKADSLNEQAWRLDPDAAAWATKQAMSGA